MESSRNFLQKLPLALLLTCCCKWTRSTKKPGIESRLLPSPPGFSLFLFSKFRQNFWMTEVSCSRDSKLKVRVVLSSSLFCSKSKTYKGKRLIWKCPVEFTKLFMNVPVSAVRPLGNVFLRSVQSHFPARRSTFYQGNRDYQNKTILLNFDLVRTEHGKCFIFRKIVQNSWEIFRWYNSNL